MLYDAPVAGDYRLQHCAPSVGAVHVSRSQRTPLDIAELVEHEQRMIASTSEMPVVCATFLFAVGRALARIHVEYDGLRSPMWAHFVNPLTGKIDKSGEVLGPAQPLCLKAAHLA